MNLSPKMETEDVICKCFQVNEATIRASIEKNNLTEIDQVTESCEAGGGCHTCHILLQLFIDEHQKSISPMETLMNDQEQKIKKPGILSRFFDKISPNPS
jgi:NAD(P)H-nitrite reductase large subunit